MSETPKYDVIVLGGGIMGAATADLLARRGQQVLLLEQFEPGHTHGSSHGDGRIIRFAYPESLYVEMAMLAYPAWDDLARRAGLPLMQKTGGWDAGPANSQRLAEIEENFCRYGITYRRYTATESNQRFPHFHLDSGSEAVYQADAGVLFATPAVLVLWRLLRGAGAEAITGVRVEDIDLRGEQVVVRAASGEQWAARRLVVTAGGWLHKLLARIGLDLPLEVTQEQVAFYPVTGNLDHRVGAMPVFIDYHDENPYYGLPQVEVPGVKVGQHHSGPVIDPDQPVPADEANFATVTRFVSERLPHLRPESFERITCLYTNTPDYHFILDRHPELPQIVIGGGFSGHGFKFAPVVAQIVAALVLDERPPVALDLFALARFSQPRAATRRTGA
jgi:monomeric sarcosine oxidase